MRRADVSPAMEVGRSRRRVLAVAIALLAALAIVPAPALAEERVGGDVIVAEGETIEGDLQVLAGRVVVRGTVTGDLRGAAGSIVVEGTVEGNVEAAAGSIRIDGTVGGDVELGAGSVVIDGTIGGDASIGADSLTFLDGGRIDGNLRYDAGTVTGLTAETVGGTAERVDDVRGPFGLESVSVPSWLEVLWGFLASLLLGVLLLGLLPAASAGVTGRVTGRPLGSMGVGLLALIGWPILMALVAITIVGIPIAVLGILLYVLALWIGFVYGAVGLGVWLLGLADREHRWGALLLGLALASLVGLVPILGGIVQFLLLLLGLGALAATLARRLRGRPRERGDDDEGRDGGDGRGREDGWGGGDGRAGEDSGGNGDYGDGGDGDDDTGDAPANDRDDRPATG